MFMLVREKPKLYRSRINREEIAPETYRKLFRFDKENVEWLAHRFIPEHDEKRGGCLTTVESMEATLHYLADLGYQTTVGEVMGISQTTVSRHVAKNIDLIAAQHPTWIKFPTSNADVTHAKERWAEKLGFPFTIGAIDCTHVRIDKPRGQFGDEFINRKNYPSFNVQATCDENYIFTSVDVGWPGSVYDSRIFQTSDLRDVVSRNVRGCLLGDSGYGISPYMMTPFADPDTPVKRSFNRAHTRNRVVIEQAFGQLKRRSPILRYGVRLKLENIPKCIVACFVLHNVSRFLHDPDDDLRGDDEDGEIAGDNGNHGGVVEQGPRILRQRGQQKRDEIANHIYERRDQ
ncbi:putative nuclease HARBI1 [Strongylocentrotus purpuratus]|uniref:DDE Tnp4 domain-containing protein n=1 Tax=Strongylocentrotus purpuratus TaxID=7668 RepID=A0A7M7GGB7_STRPU|nr:putative nuclease HARBI1 [Strongylocentrotus purpuratus]